MATPEEPTLADLAVRIVDGDRRALPELELALDRAKVARDWGLADTALRPLARAAGSGDRTAMAALLGLIDSLELAIPTIGGMLHDRHQVEEAAQATLVAVSRGVSRFEGRSRFTSWLHTVASNEARQLIRREGRRAQPVADLGVELDPGMRRMSSVLIDRVRIAEAIDGLEEPYRSAVQLREIDGLPYDEIAERLGVEPGTVKSRIARGRERLVRSLGLD
ncbi:MAG: sigma-70 family RNA polymerase sigma factor [Acidimicrobiales bacterium]